MKNLKQVCILCVILAFVSGCSIQNPATTANSDNITKPTVSGASSTPNEQITQTTNDTYPGPGGASEISEENPASGDAAASSAIPTPSNGKAVVFGEVNIGDTASLNISNLFLTPLTSSNNPEDLSSITYAEGTDPSATLNNGTGQFVFADVTPGQYALMIWTSMNAYPLGDSLGKTIVFTVNPDETKDLGVISLH